RGHFAAYEATIQPITFSPTLPVDPALTHEPATDLRWISNTGYVPAVGGVNESDNVWAPS
ncbi:MAG: hypothetical protein ACXVQY_11205, partial [Actinomycetota bacterium]